MSNLFLCIQNSNQRGEPMKNKHAKKIKIKNEDKKQTKKSFFCVCGYGLLTPTPTGYKNVEKKKYKIVISFRVCGAILIRSIFFCYASNLSFIYVKILHNRRLNYYYATLQLEVFFFFFVTEATCGCCYKQDFCTVSTETYCTILYSTFLFFVAA